MCSCHPINNSRPKHPQAFAGPSQCDTSRPIPQSTIAPIDAHLAYRPPTQSMPAITISEQAAE